MESGFFVLAVFIAYIIGIIVGKNWNFFTKDE